MEIFLFIVVSFVFILLSLFIIDAFVELEIKWYMTAFNVTREQALKRMLEIKQDCATGGTWHD